MSHNYPKNSIEEKMSLYVTRVLNDIWKIDDVDVTIEYPKEMSHGDLACNIAMQLSKRLNLPPREIASEIQKRFSDVPEIDKIEIAGPGFLNFFLSDKCLLEILNSVDESFGKDVVIQKKTIVTDISHPNAAKPMGTHHLLSTLIGDAINNLLHYVGHEVLRDSYWGDWGTQFGKLIYAYKNWGDDAIIEKDPISELLALYVEFHNRAEEDESLNDRAREEFKKLEENEKANLKIWKWIVSLSKDEFFRLYDRLNVHFDYYYGESFYAPLIPEIITEGKKKDIFVEGEGGALVVHFEDENIPTCPVIKSDGATLYHTRDIARIKYWKIERQPDEMLYVVDSAQKMHFIQLFEMARMFGWTGCTYIHAHFGRMNFADKKMSTRKGNIILMKEVLDEAESRARNLIEEKSSELNEKEKNELARIMGLGAVKYSILSQNRVTDIVFDWDKMLTFEGNSAPYLQYTYARGRSVLRKARSDESIDVNEKKLDCDVSLNEREKKLLLYISRLPNVLLSAANDYFPHVVSNYLYEFSQEFNHFYNTESILKADTNDAKLLRLRLVSASTQITKICMEILGIEVPEKM